MYASQTDYRTLYAPSYFGKAAGATSFSPDRFTRSLIDFCQHNGFRHVVDIGAGSGILVAMLRQAGIHAVSCDFDPVDADGIHLDLAGSPEESQRVRQVVQEATGGAPWLVTCLDVLEHIDIEDVATALHNLHVLCHGMLLTSISTRPSSANNKYHATVLPKASWLEILRTTGFHIEAVSIFEEARTVRTSWPDSDGMGLVSYWARMDPFGDVGQGEPDYVLAKAQSPNDRAAVCRAIERMLDTGHLKGKRAAFGMATVPRMGLNIHHPQDFILLRPLLDVLPRSDIVALVRRHALRDDEFALVQGVLARCGVETISYDWCTEIPWAALALRHLITPAESNVAQSHILSRQVVEAAKLHGINTIQLQHGLWIEAFAERAIGFGSDVIVSWGPSFQLAIQRLRAPLAGTTTPHASDTEQLYLAIGGPKFADLRAEAHKELLRCRLGVPTERFRAVVLLGTNRRWAQNRSAQEDTYSELAVIVREASDVFFIVKLHPSERAAEAAALRAANTLVLDDVLLGIIGLGVNRLIPAVDAVVSSLSTLLLDAAVAGKPCIQYDTGTPLCYEGVRPVPIRQVPHLLQHIASWPVQNSLAATYAECAGEPFLAQLAALLEQVPPSHDDVALAAAASFYSVAREVEERWHSERQLHTRMVQVTADAATESKRERAVTAEQSEHISQLMATLAHTGEALTHAQQDLTQARHQRDELRAELTHTAQDYARCASARETAERVVAEIQRSLDESTQREAAAFARAADAASSIYAMQQTVSWRLTSPLRALRRHWPRAFLR